jgi:glycosyltransferase involved in cell wall biosynthesis
MAQVTVGVPVYNGGDLLEKSLDCLREQSFRDIEVLISDNCSQDRTAEIAQRFCAIDSRFRYFRQAENVGAPANFLGVLEAASSPFFLWRAADDTSDADYIEKLLALLVANPQRDIAVARIVSRLPDGRVTHIHPVSPWIEADGAVGRLAQLFCSHHGSWIYGLFRRQAIIPILREVLTDYPYVWGWDNVTMFALEFDRKVIGDDTATFYQHLPFPVPRGDKAQRARRDDAKIEMGRAFMAFAHRHVSRTIANPLERAFYQVAVAYFGHKHPYSFSKRLRRSIARRISARSGD